MLGAIAWRVGKIRCGPTTTPSPASAASRRTRRGLRSVGPRPVIHASPLTDGHTTAACLAAPCRPGSSPRTAASVAPSFQDLQEAPQLLAVKAPRNPQPHPISQLNFEPLAVG